MQPSERANQGRGQTAITGANAGDDVALGVSRDQEDEISAAAERGEGQGDAGIGFGADDRDHPTLRLLQRGLPGKQRSGVAVLADAEQIDIEQRPGGREVVRAVLALQGRFVIGGGLLRR